MHSSPANSRPDPCLVLRVRTRVNRIGGGYNEKEVLSKREEQRRNSLLAPAEGAEQQKAAAGGAEAKGESATNSPRPSVQH